MCFWTAIFVGQGMKKRLEDEIESLWLYYARITCVEDVCDLAPFDGEKKYKKVQLQTRSLAMSLKTVSEHPKDMNTSLGLPTEDQLHVRVSATSRHPKRSGMRICRVLSGDVCRKLGEVSCTSKENRDELQESEKETGWSQRETWWSCLHSQRELRWVPENLQITAEDPDGGKFEVFRVPTFPFTSLCCLWQNDSGIQLRRLGAVVELVIGDVINSGREKPTFCPSIVFKKDKKSYVTGLWLADDLDPLVWWTLIGWRWISM